jgi:predicted RNase H-like HicB family nuclease
MEPQIMDIRYELIVYWSDQDRSFVVEVPTLKNAQVVIEEWIETARELGRDVPAPKGRLMYA